MKVSENITNLTKALFQFQGKVSSVKKSAKNPHFKSTYADLTSILDTINPILQECGLLVTQHPNEDVLITTVYHAESGEYMQSEQILRMKDLNNPQQQGSAITYSRRYALASIFNLNQEDDDGNAAASQPTQKMVKETLTPTHKMWDKAIDHLKKGNPIADITRNYSVAKEHLELLKAVK
jgi:hypothetical protein